MVLSYKNNSIQFKDLAVGDVFCAYDDIFIKTSYIGRILGVENDLTDDEEYEIDLSRVVLCNAVRLSTGKPAHIDGCRSVSIFVGTIDFKRE